MQQLLPPFRKVVRFYHLFPFKSTTIFSVGSETRFFGRTWFLSFLQNCPKCILLLTLAGNFGKLSETEFLGTTFYIYRIFAAKTWLLAQKEKN